MHAGIATAHATGTAPSRLARPAGALAVLATAGLAAAGLATVTARSPLEIVVSAVVVAWSLGGAAVLASGPTRLGALVCGGALVGAAGVVAAELAAATAAHPPSSTRELAAIAVAVLAAVVVHCLLALPDGAVATTGRRAWAGLWYAVALATAIWCVASSRVPSSALEAFVAVAAGLSALPGVYQRFTHSAGAARQRLQWLGAGTVAALEVGLVAGAFNLLVHWPTAVLAVSAAGSALVPLGLLLAHRDAMLAHAGRAFVGALTVLGFTASVVAVYLVVVLGLGSRPTSTADREVLGLSILAAAIVAVAFVPVRDRILRSATGFVYGAREAPDEVVRTFGSRLTRAIPMDELLLQLAESLRKTLALASAEVFTGTGEVLERSVSVPDRGPGQVFVTARERPVITAAGVSGNAWASVWLPSLVQGRDGGQLRVAPISHAGELLGLIVVERSHGANAFVEEDDRVLTELARQVGLAFHNAQLDTALQSSLDELRRQADELRASRARIVASGDAERRRVERNLHDGAQQHLVALAVNLRLTRDVVLEDPAAAAEMLEELAGAVQETIQELRELAHGIYPPLLVDSGLGEALRAVANRSPLDVELQVLGLARYDGDVEAALYFCCLEALQNASKHAPEAHVTIRVWEDEGGLLFEVTDDGPGFDVKLATRGHGFVNMSDRLGAIGGSVRWESTPGTGTRIAGSVPVR